MTIQETKKLIAWAKNQGIKSIRQGSFVVEFFPRVDSMNLDPVALAKTLTDSMPPDSSMLFASSEDSIEENPTPQQSGTTDMNT